MQPRIDPELPPLPPGLEGLRGVELLRAAYAATRAKPADAPRRAWKPDPVSQSTPPTKTPPAAAWTPHDAIPDEPTVAHWADDIPLPDEPPPEEEWR